MAETTIELFDVSPADEEPFFSNIFLLTVVNYVVHWFGNVATTLPKRYEDSFINGTQCDSVTVPPL